MSTSKFGQWPPDDAGFLSSIIATVVFKCLVQGYLLTACHRYYSIVCLTKDGTKMRIFVATIMFLEILHTGISIAKLYLVTVQRVFWQSHWLNPCDTTLMGVICFMAQLFFAHRCWRGSILTTGILVIFTCIVFLGTLGMVLIEWLAYGQIAVSTHIINAMIYIWGFSSASFELLVCVILMKFLWHSRTGIRGLDRVVLRLLTISMESSLPCLIFVPLFCLTVFIQDVSANFFAYATASTYGLSLMVSLNCREKVHDSLVAYRRGGGLMGISPNHTNAMTESQMFSEEALATRRASHPAGGDPNEYRRPSILSFVKEVVIPPCRTDPNV